MAKVQENERLDSRFMIDALQGVPGDKKLQVCAEALGKEWERNRHSVIALLFRACLVDPAEDSAAITLDEAKNRYLACMQGKEYQPVIAVKKSI